MDPAHRPDKLTFKVLTQLAKPPIRLLIFLKIPPNAITLFNFLTFIFLAAFCFAKNTYQWNLLGLLSLVLHTYFDFIDGLLARTINRCSKLGGWLDPKLDVIATGVLLVGIGYGVWQKNPSNFWLAVILLAFFGHFAVHTMAYDYQNTIYSSLHDFINKFRQDQKATCLDKLIKEFIILESFGFLFFGTFSYLLFLVALFNQLRLFLLVLAIFSNVRWIVMFWAYAATLSEKESKLRVINILKGFVK